MKLLLPEDIAAQILSVQPMDEAGKAIAALYKASKTEEELKKEGYEPISADTRLMWIKKE